jgi:hypothetical protein
MPKYDFPVPSSRGMQDPVMAQDAVEGVCIDTGSEEGVLSNVRDLILHAAIARFAFIDDSNLEFLTRYDPVTETVDLDIDEELLDKLSQITIGPNLEKYFSWLTNSEVNLRRDTLQFTIGSDTTVFIGQQGIGIQVGYNCYIERIDLFTNATGSITFDVLKGSAETYPSQTSISGTTKAEIVNDNKRIEVPLDGWDLELSRGDLLYYNVESVVGISLVTIIIHVCRYLDE